DSKIRKRARREGMRMLESARADLDSSTQPKIQNPGGEIAPRSGGVYALTAHKFLGAKTALLPRSENSPTYLYFGRRALIPRGRSERPPKRRRSERARWEPDRRSPGSSEGQGSLQKQQHGVHTRGYMPLRLEISHCVSRSRLVGTDRTDRSRLRRRPTT